MAKYHQIKWRESDNQELARTVKNFNAKVDRLLKKNPQMKNVLPEKVTVAQYKELINTRQDLKRELNSLKRFSQRGAEEIVPIDNNDNNMKITKWQKTEINRRIGVINRRRKDRLEKIINTEMTSRGENLGYTRGQFGMGTIEENELKPMKPFRPKMEQYELKWRWKTIRAESQSDYFTKSDFQLRDNYIKGIKENYDYESVKEVIEIIEGMNISEFLGVFTAEGSTFEIPSPDGKLDLKHQEYKAYETALKSIWMPYKDERKRKEDFGRSTSIEDLKNVKKEKDEVIALYSIKGKKLKEYKTIKSALNYIKKNKNLGISWSIEKE